MILISKYQEWMFSNMSISTFGKNTSLDYFNQMADNFPWRIIQISQVSGSLKVDVRHIEDFMWIWENWQFWSKQLKET